MTDLETEGHTMTILQRVLGWFSEPKYGLGSIDGSPKTANFNEGQILVGDYIVKMRRANSEDWVDANPVLRLGEPGFDLDVAWFKLGDGVTHWLDLDWAKKPEDAEQS